MDYQEENGVWQHHSRQALFVGDYIDRGPAIRETLNIVRTMVENNHAIALMGNHEYNALAYDHRLPGGSYLRNHSDKHYKQHEATLIQFADHADEWHSYLQWFHTLPLFMDEPGFRAIHACWDEQHIAWLKKNGHYTLNEQLLVDSHQRGSVAYTVINDSIKGKEFNIPSGFSWPDKDGNMRKENRIKWWVSSEGSTYNEFLFDCPVELQNEIIDEEVNAVVYPADAPPVFFGHYWMNSPFPQIQTGNVACLDYSIAKDGILTSYRWHGESMINSEHFMYV